MGQSYGANKLNTLFNRMNKAQQITDQKITDFEKNLGLRLQNFYQGEDELEDP